MKTTTTTFSGQPAQKTYLFGSLSLHRNEVKHTYALRINPPRLALVAGVALLICYALVVSAGYLWLREVRKIDRVGFLEVALIRVKTIRREMAAQQFAMMQAAVAAKDYRGAYLAMNSALHHDPDNVAGRLQAARFMEFVGATESAIGLLEDGLARTPDNQDLIEATLDLLTASGHDGQALKLLHGQLATQFAGPNGTLLRTYEVQASLNAGGPAEARQLLDGYPDLRQTTRSLPTVARVLWATQDRPGAIEVLSNFVQAQPTNFIGYADLATYQQMAGRIADARHTADLACAQFPKEIAPRVLRIVTLAPTAPAELSRWEQEVESYTQDFGDKPEAVAMLAQTCGRKGWVDLARLLYETAAGRQQDIRPLAMYYSDALMSQGKFPEAQRILAEIDRQTPDPGNFSVLLWQREIVAAAACGDRDGARENARRVAAALRRDPDGLEAIRQRFIKLKIPEAVAELTLTIPESKNSLAPAGTGGPASIPTSAPAPAATGVGPNKS
jgi:tetratricopeptide (TPR) repeat protein